MNGFDVSKHNGSVDFNKAKADGYDFVIIRAGFGKSNRDSYFDSNIRKALDAGLKVGVYWFLYGKTYNDIIANAKMAIATIGNYKDKITMGVWADYEYDSDRYVGRMLSTQERTSWVKAFCDYMINKGFDCGIYANPEYLDSKFGNLKAYKLWVARYTDNFDKVKNYNPYMWQYTSYGKVNGIKGNVDLNKIIATAPVQKPEPKPVQEVKKCYGIVTTKGSNLMLRSEANTKAKILKKIPNGKKVEILTKSNDWYKIVYEGITGYGFSKYIKEI